MAINWTHVYKKYKGLWVGLAEDETTVVASGKTVKEVMDKSKKKGFNMPLLFKVPTKIIPFIGSFKLSEFSLKQILVFLMTFLIAVMESSGKKDSLIDL